MLAKEHGYFSTKVMYSRAMSQVNGFKPANKAGLYKFGSNWHRRMFNKIFFYPFLTKNSPAIMTPSQPVCFKHSSTSLKHKILPLAKTGILSASLFDRKKILISFYLLNVNG